ncbi:MAG: hypothetical protein U0Q12_19405 [Vicinamibacterales bacterium]
MSANRCRGLVLLLTTLAPSAALAGPPVIQAGSVVRVRADNRNGLLANHDVAPAFGLAQADSVTDQGGTAATSTAAATYDMTYVNSTATFHIAVNEQFSVGAASALAEGFIRVVLDEPYVYEISGNFTGSGSDAGDRYHQRTFLRLFQSPFSTIFLEDEAAFGTAALAANQHDDTSGGVYNQSGTLTGTLAPGTYEFAYELQAQDADVNGAGSATGSGFVRLVLRRSQCTYTLSPTNALYLAQGGTGTVAVTAPAGCDWVATSDAAFATITSGTSGTGNGTVSYGVASHSGGVPRTATLTVAGQPFGISQTGTTIDYPLAEGATGPFFDLDVLLANPNDASVPVNVTFLIPGGLQTVVRQYTLAPQSRFSIRVDDIPGLENTAVSTVVQSTNGLPVVAERTMAWDATYYGGHTEIAPSITATKWYFAEGSQGFFDTYVLVGNGTDAAAAVTVTFLLEAGSPLVRTYAVPAHSRFNVYAGAVPQLVGKSFSIVVDSDVPIIAERAMYFGTARFWDGGHEAAGVTSPATRWFHAEGATGAYFDTYVLVGNPNPQPATVTFTWLRADGVVVTKTKTIGPNARLTVNVENEDPLLANTAVSTTVTSDIPVISERAMYWPGDFTTWFEAHDSFGVTATHTKWGLAEGRVGGPRAYETYILLSNGNAQPATVDVRFLRESGPPVTKQFVVQPTSRFNVHVNSMVPELANESFGAVVEVTNGLAIAVERALYWDAVGQHWAAGTDATAVRLP